MFSLVQPPRLLLRSTAACPRSLLPLPGRRHEEHHPTWSSTAPAKLAPGGHQWPPRPPHRPPPSAGLGLRATTQSAPRPTLPPPQSTAALTDSSTTPVHRRSGPGPPRRCPRKHPHRRPPTANIGMVLLLADPLSSIFLQIFSICFKCSVWFLNLLLITAMN
jgi:hypothetical protein